MNVAELLEHYRLEKLTPEDLELFAYFSYKYGIDYDEANHPYFYIQLFTKINRIQILEFVLDYKGRLNYTCQICREKEPCRHFSILASKLLKDEYEQIKEVSTKFAFEISDVDRREQQSAFDLEIGEVFKEIRKEEIANASTKARIKVYLEDTRFSYSVNLTIAKASSTFLPLIKSATILTFLDEILA